MIFDRVPGTSKIFATLRNGNQTDRFECVPSFASIQHVNVCPSI